MLISIIILRCLLVAIARRWRTIVEWNRVSKMDTFTPWSRQETALWKWWDQQSPANPSVRHRKVDQPFTFTYEKTLVAFAVAVNLAGDSKMFRASIRKLFGSGKRQWEQRASGALSPPWASGFTGHTNLVYSVNRITFSCTGCSEENNRQTSRVTRVGIDPCHRKRVECKVFLFSFPWR